ncbi:MAG TPA: hypothetical protein VNA23_04250 [Anaerolineales bacterium]|nr:hypothetical protein [Anaerolineales bacterium]
MDHFSYEVFSKEKVKNLREEGLRNQAVYRSGSPKRFGHNLPRLILVVLAVLAVAELLIR